jgi:perosamine synthetase
MLPLGKPAIGEGEVEAQTRALRSGRLVLGPENAALEAAIAEVAEVPHAVTVSSGTAALHAALWALDLPPGSEVLVPGFTFPAPANAAAALGLVPVPVDVDPRTWNIDPRAAAARIGPRTSAIIAVDQFGLPADWPALEALGVPLVQDAACALGARDAGGRAAGSRGVVACFSFHPRKVVTTGEGGAVCTADAGLAQRLRRLRHHGIVAPGVFQEVGLNFRLAEPAAAVGRVQVARLPGFLAERRDLVARYRAALGEPLAQAMQEDTPGRSWQTLAVVLPEGLPRAAVIAGLADAGIEAGPATFALHRLGTFAGRPGFDAAALPVSDRLHDRALALPLWNGMPAHEPDRVARALRAILS